MTIGATAADGKLIIKKSHPPVVKRAYYHITCLFAVALFKQRALHVYNITFGILKFIRGSKLDHE